MQMAEHTDGRVCRSNAGGAAFASVSACILAFALSPAFADQESDGEPEESFDPNQYSLELGAEIFRWQEFDDGSTRLLTEQGPRLFMSAAVQNLARWDPGIVYSGTLRAFGGEVEYDGQDSNQRYVGTSSRYSGWQAEAQAGYRLVGGDAVYAVDLLAGIGTERWSRDIQSANNAEGNRVAGFAEDYAVDYGRAAIGFSHRIQELNGYFDVGVRVPLSIKEDVDLDGEPIHLKPGKRGSLFLSYKLSLTPTSRGEPFGSYLKLFYNGYRFGKSDVETIQTSDGALLVWQPKSSMDIVGLALGFSY